ncbi:hypothetical protein Q7P36_009224 [Cladosporium allicinum]
MPRDNDRKRKIHKTNAKAVEAISFDPEARQEYLSGFHKRKVQRAEHGRELAQKKLKEATVQARKEMREQRKADLQIHLKEFNAELRKQNPDIPDESESDDDAEEATFEGFGEVDDIDGQEDEYVDEDKYTTVTVEAMGGSDDEVDKTAHVPKPEEDKTLFAKPKKPATTKEGKLKQKKRNFRYETKAERKTTRDKQKKRNNKEATARREANETKEKTAKSRKGKK